jgi:DNA-binding NarL/FixJ family response regulator
MEQVLRRRATPCLAVLDFDYRILDADARLPALCVLASAATPVAPDRLPDTLERMLRMRLDATNEAYLVWNTDVLVRASRLSGMQGGCIVVSMEAVRTRAPLDEAARRFSLSQREKEVLECILCGLKAANIAERLHISKRTVGEYFKHLAAKTGARNRSELVARVLDWRGELYE